MDSLHIHTQELRLSIPKVCSFQQLCTYQNVTPATLVEKQQLAVCWVKIPSVGSWFGIGPFFMIIQHAEGFSRPQI